MFDKIQGWFRRLIHGGKVPWPDATGRVIDFSHPSWGWNVSPAKRYMANGGMEVMEGAGWCSPRPKVGDTLQLQQKNGDPAYYRVVEVDYTRDPDDMFFFTAWLDRDFVHVKPLPNKYSPGQIQPGDLV